MVRGADTRRYPVALNHHERISSTHPLMPAPLGPVAAQESRSLALAIVQRLRPSACLTVEFFLTSDGGLAGGRSIATAPQFRHLTIEAAVTSQFEQQAGVAGYLWGRRLLRPAAMDNLLGDCGCRLMGSRAGMRRWHSIPA